MVDTCRISLLLDLSLPYHTLCSFSKKPGKHRLWLLTHPKVPPGRANVPLASWPAELFTPPLLKTFSTELDVKRLLVLKRNDTEPMFARGSSSKNNEPTSDGVAESLEVFKHGELRRLPPKIPHVYLQAPLLDEFLGEEAVYKPSTLSLYYFLPHQTTLFYQKWVTESYMWTALCSP
jgi:hypothetical protein